MRFLILILLFSPLVALAQIENPKGIFRELRSMEGTWFMPTDRGDRLEIWRVKDDSTLVGKAVRIKPENGDTVTLENLRLEWRGEDITYYTIARGQNNNKAIPFALSQADYDGYLFENPSNEDPSKIRYILLGNREMQLTTEGKRGNRDVKQEYVYEREFAPGAVEFRLRAGLNYTTLRKTGNFQTLVPPELGGRPGWALGSTVYFKGRGGFISLNVDFGLEGRNVSSKGEFPDDTIYYQRDARYSSTWLVIGAFPEITFKRDGRLSLIAGPYLGRLLFNKAKGTVLPNSENKLFNANNDFKKTDLGLAAGFQYRVNFGKKDVGGILGLRATYGFKNIDGLYDRGCDNPTFCNGQIFFTGVSAYYSINLSKL